MADAGSEKILIIGGGIAGLACGCYLQMNGYRTEILEANAIPGGLCVAWDRNQYVFDGCLRWLVGTEPTSKFHRIWHELGVLQGREILNHDEFLRVEGTDGEALSLSGDLDKFASDFKAFAPEDASLIDELVAAARRCAPIEPPEKPIELMSGIEKTKLLLSYRSMLFTIIKWKRQTMGSYLSRYRNPFVRAALMTVAGEERMSTIVLLMVLAFRSRRNTGYPLGGSRGVSDAMIERYQSLGGTIRCNAEVTRINVEDDRAAGVSLANGSPVPASVVISCADGYATLFQMLGGRYVSKQMNRIYSECALFPGLFQISLGISGPIQGVHSSLCVTLRTPLKPDPSTEHGRIELAAFGPELRLCPEGKTILIVRFSGDHAYWANLRKTDYRAYGQAKQRLLAEVTAIVEERYPGVAARIETADVASPATFGRYTGNREGSYQGWLPTPDILGRRFPRELRGLKNFYMAGHWIEPGGGLPSAAISGQYVAQLICAKDKKPFITSRPETK